MFLEIRKVSGDISRKNIFDFLNTHEKKKKKRNKNSEVKETFVEKVQSDEVGLHVHGANFDADEENTNDKKDKERKNTLNDFDSVDYENLIGEFLLELHENFKISTAVTCFFSEKRSAIINVDRIQHTEMFHRSHSNFCYPLDYESRTILFSESLFTGPCEKFIKEKALSNYIKQKKSFTEPVEITPGIDPTTSKADTMQYVAILKTNTRNLQHEDILSHCLNS